jgi:hypothetical protein
MSILRPYASRTAQHLANPPETGGGRHEWLFTAQAQLVRQGFDPLKVEKAMEAYCRAAGWEDRLPEVARNTAAIAQSDYKGTPPDAIAWPPIDHSERVKRYAFPPLFAPADSGLSAAVVLPALYAPSDWVCASPDRFRSCTYRLADLLPAAHNFQFIVANPMSRETGRTRAGRESSRAKDNACGEHGRRIAVIEFDTGDALRDQCAVLSSLSTPVTPLILAVYSGGKSIHGWFDVSALRRSGKRRFFQFARRLGADNALWNTAALVRMPGGVRDNGKRQAILYFNPKGKNDET